MKTITYTQMRSDLSTTLDLLRSGESVKITQRGKPDIVISAKIGGEAMPVNEKSSSVETIGSQLSREIVSNMSPQVREGVMRLTKQLNDLLQSDETRQAMENVTKAAIAVQGVSASFAKALLHTQTKHADIIKKLEDK